MSIVHEIALWAVDARPSAEARRRARLLLMDQIGISVAGGRTELPLSRRRPHACVWATGEPACWTDAALVNRYAGDDLELTAGPEVGAAALAAGEVADRTLGDVDAAIATACDVEEYLRGWLQLGLEDHGLHPPAFLSAIAAATAAARLLGLDRDRFARALASAASLAPLSPYVAFSRGATCKRLYGAWGQMLGLTCAALAREGVDGPGSVFEGRRGIAQALLDAGDTIGVSPPPFEPDGKAIERVTFKAYPCSRACHAALTALEAFDQIETETLESVDVRSYPFAVELDRRAAGATTIAAQMSLRKSVAVFLAFGELRYDELDTPAVKALVDKVRVREEPGHAPGPRRRHATVRLTFEDGRTLESAAEARWSAGRPATEDEIRERFLAMTRGLRAPDVWLAPGETKIAWLMSTSTP